jgi:hypothetical protein
MTRPELDLRTVEVFLPGAELRAALDVARKRKMTLPALIRQLLRDAIAPEGR